ncbi:hypothetical protein CEUSTIGMA_g5246.t1 [Chlamydomonas eustigma]|uniref:Integrase catalytic domain-containing protein n=1 Tax=Chlamydomonas eustigma TaxID=1157962 RepID=A0A250X3Z8_9CHLO|nr:hypothetical protein CEUSTIGMA_g5246.t1 [Chlamydomonas eustigma]|eukprot:GAX77803.1 hypothetical protein CEUSTIGMA_g5246.t1 [Chlamydomonas eustigma]
MKCRPIPIAELAQQSMVLLSGATASEAERLHRALGHPGNSALVKTLEGHVEGTSVTHEAVKQLGSCEQCLAGKQTRNPFLDSGRATDWKLGELIVFDDLFVAPANVVSQHGYKYQLTAVDYYSRYCLVSFLSHKNDAFNHMKKVHKFVERQTGNNTKCFRTDRGGEFLYNDVVDYCNELGIQLELTTTYTSQQNGLAERMHLTIFNKVRAMLVDSGIDRQHWAEAAGTTAYVYNRTASSATPGGKNPFECYWGKKRPDISNLRPFGDVAMVMTMPRKCSKAWRVLLPTGLVSESRDVVFPAYKFTAGNLLAQHGNSPATLPAASSSPPPPQHEQDSDSSGSDEDSSTESDFSEDEGDTPHHGYHGQPTAKGAAEGVAQGATTTAIRTSSRVRRPPVRLTLLAGATVEESMTLRAADDALKVDWFSGERAGQHPIPQTMEQMRKHNPYHKGYEDAIIVEMESIKARGILEPVRWERGLKVIDTKVVFDEKVDEKGLITSLKARLVAKGFRQSKGKDYTEIWAPVSKHSSLRAVLAVVAAKDWILHVRLQGPDISISRASWRAWVSTSQQLTQIASKQLHLVEEVEHGLEKDMQIKKQGDLKHHLGMEIQRQGSKILLTQKTYIQDVLYRFGMESCKGQKVPLNSKVKVTREAGEKLDKDGLRLYQEKVGSLQYLATCSRPDISFAVGLLGRFCKCPTTFHMELADQVLLYIAWTRDMGLEFGGRKPNFIVYSDSSGFGGETYERRSTTGFVCILSGGAVDWNSRLQQTVAVSTCEAEYQAVGAAVRAALWWRKLLPDLGIETGMVDIKGDNQSTLAVISNPISFDKTKHIDTIHHFTRERVEMGEVKFS